MPTKKDIKQIEKVFKKPISEIDEVDIPTFIRKNEIETLEEEAQRIKEETAYEEDYWAEQAARSDEQELENAQRV